MKCKECVFSQGMKNSRRMWCQRYQKPVAEVKSQCNADEKVKRGVR